MRGYDEATGTTGLFTVTAVISHTGAVLRVTVDDLALDTASMPPASAVAATRTIAYGYDGVDRLTSATATGSPALSQSFSYDTVGNRVVSGVTDNAANQRSDLTYDLAGNVLTDGASTSTYDALNRLTSRTASSGRPATA